MYSKKTCKMKWALNYIPMFNIRIPVLTFSFAMLEEDIACLEVLNNDIADDVIFDKNQTPIVKIYDSKYNFSLLNLSNTATHSKKMHTPVNLS